MHPSDDPLAGTGSEFPGHKSLHQVLRGARLALMTVPRLRPLSRQEVLQSGRK